MWKVTVLSVFLLYSALQVHADNAPQKLVVYKSPTCGCCTSWIAHMRASGFEVEAVNERDMNGIKRRFGIENRLQSCHTAVNIETGLVFEGHVPAGAVKKFLDNPAAAAIGLSVPGMPAGSPGMEMGNRFNPYQVVQINKDRQPTVYMNVKQQSEQYVIGE